MDGQNTIISQTKLQQMFEQNNSQMEKNEKIFHRKYTLVISTNLICKTTKF